VLNDVPRGLGVDVLMSQVAEDVKHGLVSGLRSIHDESPESSIRVVFTARLDADLTSVVADLHASFERARPFAQAEHSRIQADVANQGLAVTLPDEDWFVVRGVLLDARCRRTTDSALAGAAHQVEVCLFGDQG
jgi:hypothetical protein